MKPGSDDGRGFTLLEVLIAVVLTALLLAGVYVPGLSTALRLSHPGLRGWLVILGASLAPLVVAQAVKLAMARRA